MTNRTSIREINMKRIVLISWFLLASAAAVDAQQTGSFVQDNIKKARERLGNRLLTTADAVVARPVYMGDIVHRGQGTADGRLSPDGKYFFFVQNISPYWVDASFIEALRKDALKDDRE